MIPELKSLEDILKRNSDHPDEIDIENEVEHYFIFDKISNPVDLEKAWSLFPEHKKIRNRLEKIEENTDIIPGWGYRVINENYNKCETSELASTIDSQIKNLRPFILDGDYNDDIRQFIDSGYFIELAPKDVTVPELGENEIFGTLYEAIQEFKIEHFPYEKEHYQVLENWAIYLTKCDEVAVYLLWPCFNDIQLLDSEVFSHGAKLWKFDCRDRYWVKNLDCSSKTIYFRPPWLD